MQSNNMVSGNLPVAGEFKDLGSLGSRLAIGNRTTTMTARRLTNFSISSPRRIRHVLCDVALGLIQKPRLQLYAGSALILSYMVGAGVIDPSPFPTLCPFRLVTGMLCPLCGLTHSLHYLFRGQLLNSFEYHPLAMPFLALLLYMGVANLLAGRMEKTYFNFRIFVGTFTALSIGTYIARMV